MEGVAVRVDRPAVLDSVKDFWPGGGRRWTRRPGGGPALLVLPSARSPRLLVPTGIGGASVMLRRRSRSRRQTLAQELIAAAVRTGLISWLPVARLDIAASPSLEDLVREHVTGAEAIGVILGPPRANAKPVLQVFGSSGETLAFGKVGHDERAGSLVRAETQALMDPSLAALSLIDVPEVVFAGEWNGLQVLLLTPMGSAQARHTSASAASSWTVPMVEMVELAESAETRHESVAESSYWAGLRRRIQGLPRSPAAPTRDLITSVETQFGAAVLGFGRWHGDWAPWNMGRLDGRLELWDWEQSASGVPLGFDLVHFVVQRELSKNDASNGASTQVFLGRVREGMLAAPTRWWSTPEVVDATILLYVIEILYRYAHLAADQLPRALQSRVRRLQGLAAAVAAGGARGGQ